jgi:uncharacterized protein (DUF2235 family)
MAKNIVVFSDGTGQEGGTGHNTNVYAIFNLILDRSSRQISYYDKGLGTGWRKLTGNAVGRGFSKNVKQCYEFIFQNFEHGDRIYLFGFSRGAATVRSLSGFIHLFGILPRSRGNLIDEAWKIYKISHKKKREERAKALVDRNHTMWARVEFLGVWDTVAALGVPNSRLDRFVNWFSPHGFHDFTISDSVTNAYHALAIDDVRKTFHPVLIKPGKPEDRHGRPRTLEQVWFMGMHTDVGGGYEETELSDVALEWMVQHAVKHGLHIFPRPDSAATRICRPDPNGHMHDSRNKAWKKRIFPAKQRWWRKEFGKAVIHESVTLRSASIGNEPGAGYAPWILEHDPEVEPWTHLEDWMNDPEFTEVKANLQALAGWCEPRRPRQK